MIALLTAAALLLAGAGLSKLGRATPAAGSFGGRVPAGLELLVGIGAIAIGGRAGAGLIALSYLVLAAMSMRLMSVAQGADCGCFGRPSMISHWHTAVNLGYALIGLVGLCWPAARLAGRIQHDPVQGTLLVVVALLLGYLSYLLMTALPDLLRVAVPAEVGR